MLGRGAVAWVAAASVVAFPVVLRAQEAPTSEERVEGAVAGEEGADSRSVFVASLDAARADEAAAVIDAQAGYDRTVAVLESASAALTADARRRIQEGPLADSRQARDDALKAAQRRFEGAVKEAVEANGSPAMTVFSAAEEAMAGIRTEWELYVAVIEAADAALGNEAENSGVARRGGENAEAEYKAAEAALAEARRAHDSAAAERDAVSATRPADPKPDRANIALGTLAAGLSEAAGDYERAGAIRGQLDRETSEKLGEHAARVQRYQSRLADAEAAVEAADDVLDSASRRFNQASARLRSAREEGSFGR